MIHTNDYDVYSLQRKKGDRKEPMDEEEVTFVTCFVHIYENEPYEHKTAEWRVQQFEYIAELGVKIVVYGCEKTMPLLEKCVAKYPNVKILKLRDSICTTECTTGSTPTPHTHRTYKDTEIYKMCCLKTFQYPEKRNPKKDTLEYMALMHCKIEFVYDAIIQNVWNTRTFAWMDFSMAYIFANKESTLEKLRILSKLSFREHFMAVPGCWSPLSPNQLTPVTEQIHWRFCGTFFIGSVSSLLKFHAIYREKYNTFLQLTDKMVWEVNVWAWLETNTEWNPIWYSSDHNDRIIDIPMNLCCRLFLD